MKKSKKKKITRIVIIVSSIILVSLIILGVTQAYYSSTVYSPIVNEYTTGILSIEAVNKTDSISLTDALPMDDADALDEDPYIFTIRNIGNVDYQFDVQLLATSGNNTINPAYIKASVNEGAPMVLSNCTNSKIMENVVLKAGQTMDINLWVWLSKNNPSTPNSEIGKTFTSQIVTQGHAIYTDRNDGLPTAAQYITNLYNNASKDEAEVNNITYTLAPSVGLMRDQFGSSSSASNTGNIRYYGATPNNYVWLGDYYTENMTIPGNITTDGYANYEACVGDDKTPAYCTEDVVIEAEDRKLWRIIGVFNGRLKLVSDIPISTQGLSWDTSANTAGNNSGRGINQWGSSGNYEGADLMRLLNPDYENESVNNSLYWNNDTGTVYTGGSNAIERNISFENTGLSEDEQEMIDTVAWYTGAYNAASYVDVYYTAERQNMGKICTQGTTYCNDQVTRTHIWNGKVGLISISDFGYGTDLSACDTSLEQYFSDECALNNWLVNGKVYWTMSPYASSNYAFHIFAVSTRGALGSAQAYTARLVRPSIYLKSDVTISDGDGSQSNPYVIN